MHARLVRNIYVRFGMWRRYNNLSIQVIQLYNNEMDIGFFFLPPMTAYSEDPPSFSFFVFFFFLSPWRSIVISRRTATAYIGGRTKRVQCIVHKIRQVPPQICHMAHAHMHYTVYNIHIIDTHTHTSRGTIAVEILCRTGIAPEAPPCPSLGLAIITATTVDVIVVRTNNYIIYLTIVLRMYVHWSLCI